MTFTTLTFPCFLAIIFALYWSVRGRSAQNLVLLFASYAFYAWWDWRFCFLMLGSSLVDFELARQLHKKINPTARRWFLTTSVVVNLSMLACFKYFNFFLENLMLLASQLGWDPNVNTLSIILPLGISFYTFQTLGYTIDVYRKQIEPAKNLVEYLAFVSFFPQLVAGPIERASTMLPQFMKKRTFDEKASTDGIRQILWGCFKKMVIADRLALAVNPVFNEPSSHSGPHLAMASVFFAFQIYCDFSAYSDIAIGTAKLFNIRLTRNFAYPYFSQSVSEFWRRWHISLSYWFRDYIYIPLGGNRQGRFRYRLNLFATFLLSGLWHGAAWKFIAWGGVNGIAVGLPTGRSTEKRLDGRSIDSIEKSTDISLPEATNKYQPRKSMHDQATPPGGKAFIPHPRTLFRIYSTFAAVCLAWILFRAESLSDAIFIYQQIAMDLFNWDAYAELAQRLDADRYQRKTAIFLLAFVCWEWIFRRHPHALQVDRFPVTIRWILYTFLIWSALYLMPNTGTGECVYFEF